MPDEVGVQMLSFIAKDQRGAVAVDWVSLTAGIVILGVVVVYSVLGDSAGYLMEEFDEMNKQFEATGVDTAQALQDGRNQ